MNKWPFCFILFGSVYADQVDSVVISAEAVAAAFGYPRDKLRATDKTGQVGEKYGESIKSAILFESSDGDFAPLQVLVTKGGFLMTEKLRSALEKGGGDLRRLVLADGSVGYVGTEGFGPGAEGHVGIAHLEKVNLDIKFKVTISNDPPLKQLLDTKIYHNSLGSAELLQGILESLLTETAETITREPGPVVTARQPNLSPEAPVENIVNTTSTLRAPEVAPRSAPSADPLSKSNEVIGIDLRVWLIGGVAVFLVVVILLRLTRNKR